jgi:hypothetical protein
MRARFIGSLTIAVLLLTFDLGAQSAPARPGAPTPGPAAPRMQAPPRDAAASAPATGTARIRGRVVAADTGLPLRRAQIRVTATDQRINRSASTDAEGRYEIAELPQGRYSVFVSRNGYVALQFGQQRPFEPGRPLELGDGQLMDRLDFGLPRGGVIAGRITDELGEPMAGVRVQAMRYQYNPNGQRQLAPVNTGGPFYLVTNDLGEFRVYGLMPGSYLLSATAAEPSGMIFATTSVTSSTAAASENNGHGITYYPGTINADEAQPITVGVAEEASASFALVPARLTRVSGVVRTSQGSPSGGAFLNLRTDTGGGMMFSRGLASGPDGAFTVVDVPPGQHWLDVRPATGDGESASVPITADGRDITDLIITTTPGATISGRVIFEGTSSGARPVRVMATPADPGVMMQGRMMDSGVLDASGAFELKGVFGRVLFRAGNMVPGPTPWILKSVSLNGIDLTDTPLDVTKVGDATGLEIVMTDRQAAVSGTVKNARGEQVNDYTVAIFPERLAEGAVPARFTRVVRPDQQGRFETRGLPPGDYLAAAVESLEQGGQWDPAFRKQVEPAARRFRVTEGQTVPVELQLIQ